MKKNFPKKKEEEHHIDFYTQTKRKAVPKSAILRLCFLNYPILSHSLIRTVPYAKAK